MRVLEDHSREALRGTMDKIVIRRYGNQRRVDLDVRPSEGRGMLFWPRDLQEIASAYLHGYRSLPEGLAAR